MQRTIDNWEQFRQAWDEPLNFMLAGECVPFEFEFPPIDRIVEEMRRDPDARIITGVPGRTIVMDDFSKQFREMNIDQALRSSFALAHFLLERFDAPGKFLHGFTKRVMAPWQDALKSAGFTFDRCYPIIFISGPGSASNYHMDFSHVVAWQIYGEKKFSGLEDPERWAPRPVRVNYEYGKLAKPENLTDSDIVSYDMRPGDVLWNALLTPHWVDAGDEVAMSVNLSHGGLRLEGRLCKHEAEWAQHVREKEAASHNSDAASVQ